MQKHGSLSSYSISQVLRLDVLVPRIRLYFNRADAGYKGQGCSDAGLPAERLR